MIFFNVEVVIIKLVDNPFKTLQFLVPLLHSQQFHTTLWTNSY